MSPAVALGKQVRVEPCQLNFAGVPGAPNYCNGACCADASSVCSQNFDVGGSTCCPEKSSGYCGGECCSGVCDYNQATGQYVCCALIRKLFLLSNHAVHLKWLSAMPVEASCIHQTPAVPLSRRTAPLILGSRSFNRRPVFKPCFENFLKHDHPICNLATRNSCLLVVSQTLIASRSRRVGWLLRRRLLSVGHGRVRKQ
jgi:hypothetical protein